MQNSSDEAIETRGFRERLATTLLRVIAFGSFVALFPSAWLSIRERLWLVLAGDVGACLWILTLVLLPSISYRVKIASLIFLPYALGVLLIWKTGPFGAGHLYIFAFVFFAALFGGNLSILLANGLAILTHAAFGFARALNLVSWAQGLDSFIVISSNFVLVSLVLSYSAHYLISRSAAAAAEEHRMRADLEMMIHELEHREKNNIQVISSIVNLKSRPGNDPARAVEEIKSSLSAIAAVHHLLYRRQSLRIARVRSLLEELFSRYRLLHLGVNWDCSWDGEEMELESERAIDLGLLVNELVMNSLKHGFPEGGEGRIFIEANHDPARGQLALRIGDDGIGRRPPRQDKAEGEGRGLRIVEALARHLGAKIQSEEGPGWVYRIELGAPRNN